MASYRPKQDGLIRDKAWPSEVARQRPIGAPRIQCEEENDAYGSTIRGELGEESRVERFNRQLRGGHSQMERDEE
jgi:hypothetical protein